MNPKEHNEQHPAYWSLLHPSMRAASVGWCEDEQSDDWKFRYASADGRYTLVFHGGGDEEPLCDVMDMVSERARAAETMNAEAQVLWVIGFPSPEQAAEFLEHHAAGLRPWDHGPGSYIVRLKTGEVITEDEMRGIWREQRFGGKGGPE